MDRVENKAFSKPDDQRPLPVAQKLAAREAIRSNLRWQSGNNAGEEIPLSAGQLSMCYLQLRAPASARHNNGFEFAIGGDLDPEALEAAWQRVLQVHPLLRLGIRIQGTEPCGVLRPPPQRLMQEVDLSATPQARSDAQAQHAASLRKAFDIEQDPLLRVVLSRTGPRDYWLSVIFHHLVIDGESFRLIFEELSGQYLLDRDEARCCAEPSRVAFADFVHSQRHWLAQAEAQAALAQIREHLSGAPMLSLPYDFDEDPAEAETAGNHRAISGQLSAECVAGLEELARSRGATLFGVLYAAWVALLARWTGEEEVVCGVPAAGRVIEEMRGLVGPLLTTAVPRIRIGPQQSLMDVLDLVRDELLDCLNYVHLPIEAVIADGEFARDQHGNVLYNTLFNFYKHDPARLNLSGCEVSGQMNPQPPGSYALTLLVHPCQSTLQFTLVYAADRFAEATMQRLLQRLQIVLQAMLTQPQQALGRLDLWTDGEQASVLEWSRGPVTDYPRHASLAALFAQSVEQHRQRVALVDGERSWSFAELDSASHHLARILHARGLGIGAVCALRLRRSAGFVIAMLASVKCGAVYFPVDPQQPLSRLQFALEDAMAVLMLVDEQGEWEQQALPCPVMQLDALMSSDSSALPPFAAVMDRPADSCVNLMYTSGSTGLPKGIEVTHRGIIRLVFGHVHYPFGPEAVYLFSASISFDSSTRELWASLLRGARLITLPPDSYDPAIYAAMIRRHGVTHVSLTTALFHLFVEEMPDAFASLPNLLIGGEAVQREPALRFIRANPHCRLVNTYGPTENTTDATWFVVDEQLHPRIRSVPIGRPIANSSAYVLDDAGQLCPIGFVGELYNGGDGLAIGYRNRPEANANAFITMDSAFHSGRLYRTGDRCRWLESGELEFLGRLDNQIKYRGYRIELGEIETALRMQPGVRDAMVFLATDTKGQPSLLAAVCGGSDLHPQRIRNLLGQQTPSYMIPEGIAVLPEFPLVGGCKLDRKRIFAQLQEQLESTANGRNSAAAYGELTTLEQQIAIHLRELLGPVAIGPFDTLPALGVHSLRLVRLRLRMERLLGRNVPLALLLKHPVLRDLANALQGLASSPGEAAAALPDLPVVEDGECGPLTWSQHLIWNAQLASEYAGAYNLSGLLQLPQVPDRERLIAALEQVIKKHEGLRCGFRTAENGSPLQQPAAECAIELLERNDLDPAAIAAFVAKFQRQPFNLSHAPLLRVALLIAPEGGCQLLLCAHHLIMDGEGLQLLFKEWDAAWHERLGQSADNMRALAQWESMPVVDSWLREDLSWWQQQLDGLPAQNWTDSLQQPEAIANDVAPVSFPSHDLSPAALRRRADELQCTLHDLLFAAYSCVLGALLGTDDICVGLPFANHEGVSPENLIGTMVNSLPVRLPMASAGSFTEWLRMTHSRLRDAYAHGRLPFALLCQHLDPQRHPRSDQLMAGLFSLVEREPAIRLFGDEARWLPCPHNSAKVPLSLNLFAGSEQLQGYLDFDPAIFSNEAAQAVMDAIVCQLRAIAESTGADIPRAPLLGPVAIERIRQVGTGPAPSPSVTQSVYQVFDDICRRFADAHAIRHAGASLSYAQLHAAAEECAARLWRAGVRPGMPVAVEAIRHPRRIIAELALLRIGATYVPLDLSLPRQRLSQLASTANVRMLILCSDCNPLLPASEWTILPAFAEAVEPANPEIPDLPAVPSNPAETAYIMFTSGSTGQPKAISIPHAGIIRLVVNCNYVAIAKGDRIAHIANPAFDAVTFEVWGALLNGATLVIHEAPVVQDLEAFPRFLQAEHIRHLFLTTALFNTLSAIDPEAFSSVDCLIVGGERLDAAPVRTVLNAHAPRQLLNGYGPTENTTFSCTHQLALADCDGNDLPIGAPISGTSAFVVNRWGQLLPAPFIGELWLGGAGLANGYLGSDINTTAFIEANFFGEPCRWYRSGDLFWLDQMDRLRFIGRRDGQIKLRGHRIELGEIAAVAHGHPDVLQAFAMVAGRTSEERRILLFYRCHASGVSGEDLQAWLQSRLPGYMLPSAFHEVPDFPLNANGKIDQAALLARSRSQPKLADVAAVASATTSTLLHLWEEFLPHAAVGPHSDFFANGGNSLLAFRLLTRIKTVLGRQVRFAQLLAAPTPAAIAQLLDSPSEMLPSPQLSPSLVPMHAANAKSCAPLIGVYGHAFHSSPYIWNFLKDHLGADQALFGLQGGGIDGRPITADSLSALAAEHAKELTAAFSGPLRIIGYCTGGFLAWELACQLKQIGAVVHDVILVDSLTPHFRGIYGRQVRRRRLLQRIYNLQVMELLAVFTRFAKRLRPTVPQPAQPQTDGLVSRLDTAKQIPETQREDYMYRKLAHLFENWRPSPWSGDVQLLRSAEVGSIQDDCGWGEFATGKLTIHQTDLPHHMFYPIHYNLLAHHLLLAIRNPSSGMQALGNSNHTKPVGGH